MDPDSDCNCNGIYLFKKEPIKAHEKNEHERACYSHESGPVLKQTKITHYLLRRANLKLYKGQE